MYRICNVVLLTVELNLVPTAEYLLRYGDVTVSTHIR